MPSRDPQWNTLTYATTCKACGEPIHKGERAYYYPLVKAYYGNRCECGFTAERDFEAHRFDEEQ